MPNSSATESEPLNPSERSAFPRAVKALWAPALIVLAIAAAYAGSLHVPFVLDDITSIGDNPTIRHLWPPWQALSPPPGKGLTPNGRPLVNLSLAVNYAISGTGVWSYHALNLAIHILAALTLFGVVRRTLGWSALSPTRWVAPIGGKRVGDNALHPTITALAVALLWALHPLQTESVTYIVQRAESMMGLFYLLTLYGFIRYVEGGRRPPGGGHLIWASLSVLACLCGMASKEVMVSAPLVVLLYDRTFVVGSFAEAWRRRRGYYRALAATWVLLAYEVTVTGSRGGTAGFDAHVAWWRYALTQFPAIVHYLRLCVWPHPLVFDYGMGLALQKARVLPYAAAILALLAGTVLALLRPGALGSGRRALGFAGAWFFLILAPTSSVVPVATQTMAEHRMYLPLAAVVAAAVIAGFAWAVRFAGAPARQGVLITTLGCAALLGILTARRNRDYRTNLELWTVTVRDYPKNMRGLYNLGVSLTDAGRLEEAVKEYQIVVQTQPDYVDAHHNLANSLVKLGRVEESLIHYEIAVGAHPDSPDIQCSLGIALLDTDRVKPAIDHFQAALRLRPGMAEATYQLGEALLRDGRPADALLRLQAAEQDRPKAAEIRNALGNAFFQLDRLPESADSYREALRLDPAFAEAHNNLGNLLLQTGRTDQAIAEFRAALRAKADFAEAHNNLGDALMNSGSLTDAADEFRAAVRLKPDSADAHYNLANSLARLDRSDEAAAQYREVLRLRPAYAEAHNNLGIALIRLDRPREAREQFEQALRLNPNYADARDNLAKLGEPPPGP